MLKFQFFSFLFLLFKFSSQQCIPHTKNCSECHPITNLCATCEKNIYKPDLEGGCELKKQCILGKNYCNECNKKEEICLQCELGFFPDENGGCANTDNCLISQNGKCLECKEDFYLIEGYSYNICKYKLSDDLKNCAEIDFYKGICNKCNDGFFLNSEDKKCTNTKNCKKSSFGICNYCEERYYLDKNDNNLCKEKKFLLNNCKNTLDGKNCNECQNNFYFSEDGLCTNTQNCLKTDKDGFCIKCKENYYLTQIQHFCISVEHCYSASYDFHLCEICENGYLLDIETKNCILNDNNFNFCLEVKLNNCTKCINNYFFDKNGNCVSSKNCTNSENGICIKCDEGYHLGLDNKCVNIEKCIFSDIYGECYECEKNYFYDYEQKKCFLGINQFKNCQKANISENYCEKCKDDFYLNSTDKLCYNNSEKNFLYKCAYSNKNNECIQCINNYFLGSKDLKCSKIEFCAISENENKCIECDDDCCLNIKKQECFINFLGPKNENETIYYNCNKTNDEGTECNICIGNNELKNGICMNKKECAEEKNDECIKCNEKSENGYNLCLNKIYGCVENHMENCLRCDNIFDFDFCTECKEGYELTSWGNCVEK